MTAIYEHYAITEVKDIILYYPSNTQVMVYSHCEILWSDDSGAGLGCYPTENYRSGLDDAAKQEAIDQKFLRSKILGLRINNYLANYAKWKLGDFRSASTFNTQDDESTMFFVILN